MSRYLAIDWNPPQLHVLAVDTAKGHARAGQALAVALDEELTPKSAERIGRKLRDALKAAGIAAAPALWTIGRDRFVLKELTIPPTPMNEEPAIVRFQVAKESTEPMGDAVIDYTYAAPPQPNQPRKVLAVIARKSVVQSLAAVSAAAGLKLKAVTPRAFAASGLVARKGPSAATQAILLPTGAGAEFLVFRGSDLAWARTFPSAATLTNEVRRTLLLMAGQNPETGTVERVLAPPSLNLGALPVPVEPLDPWLPSDTIPASPEAYLAPLGLAEARRKLSINLAAPKEPTATIDHGKRSRSALLVGALVVVPLFFIFGLVAVAKQRTMIADLMDEKEDKDKAVKNLEQARANNEGLREWEQTTISWLDELYDVAAYFPHEQGLRITQLSAAQMPRKAGANPKELDKYVGVETLHGVMPPDQDKLVANFMRQLRKDYPHLRVTTPEFKGNEFTIRVEVAAQPGSKYKTKLDVPPQPKRAETPPDPEPAPPDPTTAAAPAAPAAPDAVQPPTTPPAAATEPNDEDEP